MSIHFAVVSPQADAVLAILLVLVLGYIATWDSPFFAFDAGVLLSGVAFACPVFWRGSWSSRFLTRITVTAFFFRSIVLYLMGVDAVRLIAVLDTGMGLVAIGSVYAARRAVCRCTARDGVAAQEPVLGGVASSESGRGEQVLENEVAETAKTREVEKVTWSPPQYTLTTMFVVMLASSGLFTVGVAAGPKVAFGVLVLGLFWFLFVGCIRVAFLGRREGQR